MKVQRLKVLSIEKDGAELKYFFLIHAKPGNFFLFDYWCFLTTPNRISDDDLRSLIESIDGREMERNRKETNEAMGGYDFKSIQKYDTAVGKLSIGAFRKKDYTQGYGHSFLWDRLPFTDNA